MDNKNIKVAHVNIRSLVPVLSPFLSLITDNLLDIIAVTETWLTPQIPAEVVDVRGFRFLRKDRKTGRGGGVGIYIRNDIKYSNIDINQLNSDKIENIWIKVKIKSIEFAIGALYRPPQTSFSELVEYCDNALSHVIPEYDNVIVLGDLNVNVMLSDNRLNEIFESYSMSQIIDEPTRVTSHSSTLIDPIYLNIKDKCSKQGTINADLLTDHRLVYCELLISVPKHKSKLVTFRDFRHFNTDSFNTDLYSIPWHNLLHFNDIDEKVMYLTNGIQMLFDKHAPLRTVRVTRAKAPWLTSNLKLIYKERDKALEKHKSNPNDQNWNHYRELRNFALASTRREKTAYLQHLYDQTNASSFFKALKSLKIVSSQESSIPLNLAKPESVNNYFASVFQQNNNDCKDAITFYRCNLKDKNKTFTLKLATQQQILNIIKKIKSNSCGSDNVSREMVVLCLPVILDYITHIINCCIEVGYFPDSWKESIIIPLPKTAQPASYNDLRPISLLPILAKVLEAVVYKQLYEYLTVNKYIPVNQSGFRSGHSTSTAIMELIDNISRAYDSGEATALVLLDFSKAFDTINHNLLLAKCRYYGFCQKTLSLFSCYFKNRTQTVKIDNQLSTSKPILSGVPQGSMLGPLLFLLYTADISSIVTTCTAQFYADDTQLYHHFKPDHYFSAFNAIERDLVYIQSHCKKHGLRLNPDKSKVIVFCHRSKRTFLKENMLISLGDELLKCEKEVKILGVRFDESLRFIPHINDINKRCYVALKLLYANKHILNFKTRKRLCESIVISKINYSNVAYYPCLDKLSTNKLQKIQNTCCRFIKNLRKYDRISSHINDLKWLNVGNTYRYNFLCTIHRVLLTSVPEYIKRKLIHRSSCHYVNLRHPSRLDMPKHRTTLFRRSFSYNAAKLFNQLDDNMKSLSVHSFKSKLKMKLLVDQVHPI